MEDITQQNCPKGGKHKLSYLKNVYSIACEKCRQVWTRHPPKTYLETITIPTTFPPLSQR